jgi:hypothetical protein
MIDPTLSLAVSVYHNKGVYALLLGSGISRSSGIPTGWEVLQDLIRRIAHLKKETCEPDPDSWFIRTFGVEPNYSDLLDQLAASPAERSQVLRGYFEPTEEERTEGRKRPTKAHAAIARLIAKGYVRVVITTNFDRLLEQALTEIGVQPVVVSTADSLQGTLPLAHSPCSIIKINGDHLDTRLRNTRGELERYDEALDKVLDQVFDEYGLIVAGWSAEWDAALCGALQRCASRRFATYWAQRGPLRPKATDLIALRTATVLPIADADNFFQQLEENISALESFTASDPLSVQVAVARLKKYVSDDVHRILLSDLLHAESERVRKAIVGQRFAVQTPGNSITGESILARLRLYESALDVLLPLLACGAYWARPEQFASLLRSFKRLAGQPPPQAGMVVWLKLMRYPSLLLQYGMGLAALASSNYLFVRDLLDLAVKADPYKPEKPVAQVIHNTAVMERDVQKLLPGRERQHTPLSNHLFDVLREPLRDYLPDDQTYETTFDWFEYLLGLVHCDQQVTRRELEEQKSKDPSYYIWGPVGRFGWKTGDDSILLQTRLGKDGVVPKRISKALQAGFFESGDGTKMDKFLDVKAGFDQLIGQVRREWGVFF